MYSALALLLLVIGVGVVVWTRQATPGKPWVLPPLAEETSLAKAAAVRQAFNTDAPPASPSQLLELAQFFRGLDARLHAVPAPATPTAPAGPATSGAAATPAPAADAANSPINCVRLFEETNRHGIIETAQFGADRQFRSDLIAKIAPTTADWIEALADVADFKSALITQIVALPDFQDAGEKTDLAAGAATAAPEVLVYLRRTDEWGGFGKERWWLRKSGTGWQIYDYENLYTGERLSQYIAFLIDDVMQGAKPEVRLLVGLGKSSQFTQEDPAVAAQALAGIDPKPLKPPVRALYEYCAGAGRLRQQDFAGAQSHFETALALKPDFTAALILRGECLNRQGQYAEAIAVADRVETLVGRDPHAAELRAAALLADGRTEGLADQFRTVLDFEPGDRTALDNLYDALPVGHKEDLVARFEAYAKAVGPAQSTAVAEIFAGLASRMVKAQDADTLEQLVNAQAARAPHEDWVLLYRVKVFQLRDQPEAELDALNAGLADVKDPKILGLLSDTRFQAMVKLKRAVDGYNLATDKASAFRVMAEALQDAKDTDGLAALILARAKDAPDDVWVHFFAGIRSLMMKDFARAEAHLELAVPKTDDPVTQDLFRQYWLFAAYKADHGIQAFDTAANKKAAFVQLAHYYLADSRVELLEMLATRYAKIAPAEPELILVQAEVQFFGGHYQEAIDALTAHREAIQKLGHNQSWDFCDCLLRSEIRLKQYATAEAELVAVGDPGEQAFFTAVLAARQGDVAKTRKALQACLDAEFTLQTIYTDVDIGPVLLGEGFAAVRAAFPPPANLAKTAPAGADEPVLGPVKPPDK